MEKKNEFKLQELGWIWKLRDALFINIKSDSIK